MRTTHNPDPHISNTAFVTHWGICACEWGGALFAIFVGTVLQTVLGSETVPFPFPYRTVFPYPTTLATVPLFGLPPPVLPPVAAIAPVGCCLLLLTDWFIDENAQLYAHS